MVAHRRVAVRQRIGRIEFDGTFEQHERSRHLLGHAGIDVELGPRHEVVGIEAVGALTFHPAISARMPGQTVRLSTRLRALDRAALLGARARETMVIAA
jgi:hypothetical protein